MPAVSTSTNSPAGVFQRASTASIVVPGRGSTIMRGSASRAFTIDDLPTLGRPMMAMRPTGSPPPPPRPRRPAPPPGGGAPAPHPPPPAGGGGAPPPRGGGGGGGGARG